MNFTVNHVTFPALLLGDVPKPTNATSQTSSRFLIPSTDKSKASGPFLNRQWQEIYWRGHRWGPFSAILSGVTFLVAAYFAVAGSKQQYLYGTAAVAAASVVPWTLVVMAAGNRELHLRGDAQCSAVTPEELKEIEGKEGDIEGLVSDWLFFNEVRAFLALTATALGIAASLQSA